MKPTEQPRRLVPLGANSDSRWLQLIESREPIRRRDELILSQQNRSALDGLLEEIRQADTLRRHGLSIRSKLLFCGPPGCGKTVTAETLANELHLPFLVARLDGIVSSYLGETAANLRKLFDTAQTQACVLFIDEFDALARARSDTTEHSELRRVVNSLLMMIDGYLGRGLLIAATNFEASLDSALWRRFDEVLFFDMPRLSEISQFLRIKTKNFEPGFTIEKKSRKLVGLSYADIERICVNAIKRSILRRSRRILETEFDRAISDEHQRQKIKLRLKTRR
jgi:SpoVK/Ycf46/Vps4 family AAA+-type ATPase